jgi:hypothetical protein
MAKPKNLPFTYFTILEWYLILYYVIWHHQFVFCLNLPFFYFIVCETRLEKKNSKFSMLIRKDKIKSYIYDEKIGPLKHFKRT